MQTILNLDPKFYFDGVGTNEHSFILLYLLQYVNKSDFLRKIGFERIFVYYRNYLPTYNIKPHNLAKNKDLGQFFPVGMACQPVLYTYSGAGNMALVVASGAFLSFFTFATPLLIHSFSKKYVTKLYYNQVSSILYPHQGRYATVPYLGAYSTGKERNCLLRYGRYQYLPFYLHSSFLSRYLRDSYKNQSMYGTGTYNIYI